MEALSPGLEIGARFVLVRRIGRGGSAEVWLAADRERGGEVALKFLDAAVADDPARLARLGEEVARSRSLPAECCVAIHGLERSGDRPFLVMEYLEGGDLGRLRGRSYEAWARAVDDVAAALEALHARGLVHRDLKCANVFLDGDGRAKLGDFGLAALAGEPAAGHSPYNASPQQLRGEPAQPADDLYAFGALLYELIAGHPPFYPDINRDRVLHEPVPPLLPRAEVPVAVRELALRGLAKSAAERPATARELRQALRAAGNADDAVQPVAHALPAGAALPPRRGRHRGWAVALGVAVALGGLAWFQSQFAGRDSAIAEGARRAAEREGAQQRTAEQRRVASQSARDAADAARAAFEKAFRELDGRAAARWATAAFAQARDTGAAAAQRLAVGDPASAAERWNRATAALAAIEKGRPAALAAAMQRGEAALDQVQFAAARAAFELALAIEPQHPPAQAGLARAGRLEEALALVDAASRDEQGGRLDSAQAGFRRALALDAAVPGARAGLDRLAARASADAYAAAMSRGLQRSAAGDVDSARAAFGEAQSLRPGAQEVKDAIAALDRGQRAGAIEALQARARAAESGERWDEALVAWREAASLEPTLESAREGVVRSAPRAELQQAIEALVASPERLWDPAGRAQARGLLARAAQAGNPRERLAAAARELERLAAAAAAPVRLRLESDGLTDVVIYRVGQYGAFSAREVELLPGRYTVVGTRTGFRDVRREVILPPGTAPAAVVVRCEEPI